MLPTDEQLAIDADGTLGDTDAGEATALVDGQPEHGVGHDDLDAAGIDLHRTTVAARPARRLTAVEAHEWAVAGHDDRLTLGAQDARLDLLGDAEVDLPGGLGRHHASLADRIPLSAVWPSTSPPGVTTSSTEPTGGRGVVGRVGRVRWVAARL